MTTVLIADDHPVVLSGLRAFVDADRDLTVVGTAADGQAAIKAIAELKPDLAIVDLNMPLAGGLEVLASAQRLSTQTRVIVMAAAATDSEVHALVTNGVSGLLFKESAAAELLDCLRAVSLGQRWLSPRTVESLNRHEQRAVDWRSSLQFLTPQERRIAALAGKGRSNKEIAFELGLSEGTVKVHLNSVFRKLGLSKRSDLVNRTAGLEKTPP